jgi:hypothetical protein
MSLDFRIALEFRSGRLMLVPYNDKAEVIMQIARTPFLVPRHLQLACNALGGKLTLEGGEELLSNKTIPEHYRRKISEIAPLWRRNSTEEARRQMFVTTSNTRRNSYSINDIASGSTSVRFTNDLFAETPNAVNRLVASDVLDEDGPDEEGESTQF